MLFRPWIVTREEWQPGKKSRAAEAAREALTSRPAAGQRVSQGPRPVAALPTPRRARLRQGPSPPPRAQPSLPTCRHADSASPELFTRDLVGRETTTLRRSLPARVPNQRLAARDPALTARRPAPSAEPAPRLPPACSTHEPVAVAMT